MRYFLDFEEPIAQLQGKIEALKLSSPDISLVNISEEIHRLEKKVDELTHKIFAHLTPWQTVMMARHPLRPQTKQYIDALFTDFDELHGDRHSGAGDSLIGGIGFLDGIPMMVIGHQKGTSTTEKIQRNFGMARPDDYRKALRLFQLAEKFKLPIITFIDTVGAYPGIGAEEQNQSEAIARNLFVMSNLKTPIICTVIGEGGSGGALAIGVGDRIMMLQYSIYSVISPEGCASILWKSAEKAADAASAMGMTADRINELGLIDGIIPEPSGGAHRNIDSMMSTMKSTLVATYQQLAAIPIEQLIAQRYEKLMRFGLDSNV